MKFNIQKSILDKHITIAQRAISNKSSIQILEGIVFTAKDNQLILTSTDMELSIETRVDCDVIREGSIVIKSTIIGNIIRKMPNDIISITVEDENVNIKSQNSVFNISGKSSFDYPSLPDIEENPILEIENDDLNNAIKETIFATSSDETRLALTGILFELEKDEIRFVGLDGYRMAIKKYDYKSEDSISCIVPKRAFMELSRILDESSTNITIIKGHIVFSNGDTKMYSKLIDKKYIDYRKIISNDYKTKIVVNRNDLINSLDRALLLSTGSSASLTKLNFEDGVIQISSNSDYGDLDEKVFCKQDGENIMIAFNTRYLLDGLKAIEKDEVLLHLNSALQPMNIYAADDIEDYLYLVLPVRLSN